MIDPILQVYEQATQAEHDSGLAFYPTARDHCRRLAGDYGIGLDRIVAACAVISPGLTWKFNQRELGLILDAWQDGIDPGGLRLVSYRVNRAKAIRCLDGDLDALHGSKVEAFYQDILNGGDCNRITVDRWAARAAGLAAVAWIHPALYRRIESAYLAAAERVGLAGTGLQAIVWYTVQRLAKNWAYQLNFAGGVA